MMKNRVWIIIIAIIILSFLVTILIPFVQFIHMIKIKVINVIPKKCGL